MTTTASRPTTTGSVPKGARTAIHAAYAARCGTDGLTIEEAVAIATGAVDPALEDRRDAVNAHGRAVLVADAARLTALAYADLIEWDRLPQSFRYRAAVRRWLDAVCTSLEDVHATAAAAATLMDPELHPIAHGHYVEAANAAWRERMTWAVLRDNVRRYGR